MFAVFNRFDRRYEEARATSANLVVQTSPPGVVPILRPSPYRVGLFGFTLSYDEFSRSIYTSRTFTPCRSRSTDDNNVTSRAL